MGPSQPTLASSFLQDLGESLSFGVKFLRAAILGVFALWPLWPLWLALIPLVLWWARSHHRRAIGPHNAPPAQRPPLTCRPRGRKPARTRGAP